MRLAAAALLVAVSPALAEHPTRLTPEAPGDGATTGRKPRFVVRADGAAIASARFRIELSRDEFRTVAYAFDQVADPNGWVYAPLETGAPAAIYAPRRPIAAGRYAWRVASWDGVTWRVSPTSYRLDVDDVPPAEVTGLGISRSPSPSCVSLRWDPVFTDARGNAERVARYHVLRFTSAAAAAPPGGAEVGTSPAASFEDCDPALAGEPLLYYRVVAEDVAGNVPGAPSSVAR